MVLFYYYCLNNQNILRVLKKEGYLLGIQGLTYIWKKLGLYHRVSQLEREALKEKIRAIIQKELDNGLIEDLGHRNLHTYF
jgi:hypothetical protein